MQERLLTSIPANSVVLDVTVTKPTVVVVTSVTATSTVGSAVLQLEIFAESIPATASVGTPSLRLDVYLTSVASASTVGAAFVRIRSDWVAGTGVIEDAWYNRLDMWLKSAPRGGFGNASTFGDTETPLGLNESEVKGGESVTFTVVLDDKYSPFRGTNAGGTQVELPPRQKWPLN